MTTSLLMGDPFSKGINDYLIALLDLSKDFVKLISTLIIERDIFPPVSTVHDVVKRAFIFSVFEFLIKKIVLPLPVAISSLGVRSLDGSL